MPRPLALALVPLALLATILAGCTQPTRLPPPEPSAAGEPLFASDEEALAAAFNAYGRYIRVSNTLSSSMDADTALLAEVAVVGHVEEVAESIEDLRAAGLRTEGQAEIRAFNLQQHFESANGDVSVLTYVCLDVTNLRVVDEQGQDKTPAERDDLVGLEVVFWAINGLDPDLKVASSKSWTGSDLCGG